MFFPLFAAGMMGGAQGLECAVPKELCIASMWHDVIGDGRRNDLAHALAHATERMLPQLHPSAAAPALRAVPCAHASFFLARSPHTKNDWSSLICSISSCSASHSASDITRLPKVNVKFTGLRGMAESFLLPARDDLGDALLDIARRRHRQPMFHE
jgi:hypothetical protein